MIEQDLEVTLMLATLRQALEDKARLEQKVILLARMLIEKDEKKEDEQKEAQAVADQQTAIELWPSAKGTFVMGPDGALMPAGHPLVDFTKPFVPLPVPPPYGTGSYPGPYYVPGVITAVGTATNIPYWSLAAR